ELIGKSGLDAILIRLRPVARRLPAQQRDSAGDRDAATGDPCGELAQLLEHARPSSSCQARRAHATPFTFSTVRSEPSPSIPPSTGSSVPIPGTRHFTGCPAG